MPELGDYVRVLLDIKVGDDIADAGQVFEVIERIPEFPNLAGVYIGGRCRWLGAIEYEPLTPFEAAVYKRLEKGDA